MSEDDPSEEVENEEVVEEAESKTGGVPWLPLVIVLLVVPLITIAGMEFVVIPKLKSALLDGSSSEAHTGGKEASKETAQAAETEDAHGGGGHGGGGGDGEGPPGESALSYKFEGIVSNLAGTMGTRFIKASFEVTGGAPNIKSLIRDNKAQVQDAIMSVMSSRTIKELEAPGGRNALRVSIIEAVNEALGISIVEELYFMELIIQ